MDDNFEIIPVEIPFEQYEDRIMNLIETLLTIDGELLLMSIVTRESPPKT